MVSGHRNREEVAVGKPMLRMTVPKSNVSQFARSQ